ncbi:bile acid:sodium symporter family protein [Asticcacaulis excentricus]|uniref:Bile acid:sodium symporter n=1 Tax=Asticcacaulis excentricus (strain ATCC 15261 / DSM 4724 / KCTC 12464 / NCIMB 9791 / VKM B-1370 / CB 48) TaxID=573065 RepID=E8RUS9_ASTEC|nr:bile acid:sodium symporter family protein [Asticcacaulis excentricus]ADU14129.1 Bile acid:sodium symporter [Asticcacaulis excentricus CB 48]
MAAPRKPLIQGLDPFIVLMLGLVILASVLPVRGRAAVTMEVVTDAAIFLLFFLHGAKLSREAVVAGLANWRVHLLVLATTFILFPLIGLALNATLAAWIAPSLLSGFLFLCLLPSTVQSSIAFTGIAGGNVAAAVCSASLSNLLGIVLTPILAGALMAGTAEHVGGVSFDAVQKIASQLLLPFVLGHLSRPWTGGFIDRHKLWIGRVDRSSILLVVYTAFSASIVEGLWSKVSVGDLVAVLVVACGVLALILTGTWYVSGWLGFSHKDRIVILFCGSKKSLASGVPMASILFPASVLGPIILPLMVFHQIQLISCAVIAQRLNMKNGPVN